MGKTIRRNREEDEVVYSTSNPNNERTCITCGVEGEAGTCYRDTAFILTPNRCKADGRDIIYGGYGCKSLDGIYLYPTKDQLKRLGEAMCEDCFLKLFAEEEFEWEFYFCGGDNLPKGRTKLKDLGYTAWTAGMEIMGPPILTVVVDKPE